MDGAKFALTRSSLLERLKDLGDEKSWREFFDCFWPVIYNVAARAGLSDEDVEDVVQDTIVKVVKSIGDFEYRRGKGSFKSWLRVLTRAALADFCRKRGRQLPQHEPGPGGSVEEVMARVVDPQGPELERVWDEEWRENLMHAALELVKRAVSPRQFQIFHCHCVQEWPVGKVCRVLGVSAGQVYMAKHRVGGLFKKELELLRENEQVSV